MKTNSKLSIVILCIILLTATVFAEEAAVIKVNEGELVNLKITAKDADQDILTYEFDPPLNSSGQWQTTYGDYGEWDVNVRVSDGITTTVKPVKIQVYKSNRPPVLKEINDIVIYEGESVEIIPESEDEEGDDITYTISEPVGNNGIWETTYEDSGDYIVTITADDGNHDSVVSSELLIVVKDVNRDPKITDYSPSKEEIEMEEGEELTFLISGEDPDGDNLTYSWELDGTEVSTLDSYTYSLDYESAGTYTLKASLSDGIVILSVSWSIEVEDVNRAPVLEKVNDIIVNEGDLVIVDFTTSDPDGDDVRYSLSEPIGDDKEWQTGFEDAGTYEIELIVSDGDFIIEEEFNVIVKDVDRAPVFEDIEDIEITELESVNFDVKADDPDGDTITITAENLPEGAEFDGEEFSFSTGYETIFKTKHWTTTVLKFLRLDNLVYRNRKSFHIKFTAEGKEKSSTKVVNVIVNNLNRAPVLLDLEDITVNEGEKVTIVPNAVEYDNDRVKFSISGPIGNNGKYKPGFFDTGEYPITVTASDGEFTDTKEFTLTVNNVNRAPSLDKISDVTVKEGETASIALSASDPDYDELVLSAESLPEGAEFSDGVLTWTPDNEVVDYRDGTNSFEIVFTAADWEHSVNKTATIIVKDINRIPELDITTPSEEEITITEGESLIFKVNASDPDGDEIHYNWNFGLFDKLKDSTYGVKRTFHKAGTKHITALVNDGDLTVEKTWKVNVIKAEEEPETPAAKIVSYGGKTYKLVLYAGEDLTASEKLIEKDNLQYKLSVV